MKILIFKIGAIGDTLMATPFLRQLRKNYPKAKIDFLIGNIASQVLEGNKDIDEIIRFDEQIFFRKNPIRYCSLVLQIRKRRYDMVFVLDKHLIFNTTAKLFGIPKRIGFDRMGKEGKFLTAKVYFDGSMHEIRYYLELLAKAAGKINPKDILPQIALSKDDERFAQKILSDKKIRKSICISPGGANNPGQKISLKVWPKERFAELAGKIPKRYSIILVGDKNDHAAARYVASRSDNKNIIDLTGKTTIKQTAALMKRSNYVISSDTGPMHIASCVNGNIISLFGPTDPKRFAPLNKESRHIFKGARCCPCNDIYGKFSDCKDNECMKSISVDDVIKYLK